MNPFGLEKAKAGAKVCTRDRETGKVCSETTKSAEMAHLRSHYHGDRTIAVRKIEWEE